ncbi:hypothetical protein SAMN05444166_3339 [Singulisphaera sp. GP187]|nr:hypothetical protein SAMN05444166_3339 [Singulisphaera sp. GP187]
MPGRWGTPRLDSASNSPPCPSRAGTHPPGCRRKRQGTPHSRHRSPPPARNHRRRRCRRVKFPVTSPNDLCKKGGLSRSSGPLSTLRWALSGVEPRRLDPCHESAGIVPARTGIRAHNERAVHTSIGIDQNAGAEPVQPSQTVRPARSPTASGFRVRCRFDTTPLTSAPSISRLISGETESQLQPSWTILDFRCWSHRMSPCSHPRSFMTTGFPAVSKCGSPRSLNVVTPIRFS